ncbi:MAG TPA: hypothetical protein VGR62_10785 [Candidatus Binatia bacterium]|jgi:hypothetical protein|nr:hypothetical protein [Candidatus Binatia bacterium]
MRIAYFTGGAVGAGHLVRGVALGRALRRAGIAAEYRMFGPALPFPIAGALDYEVVALDAAELRDPVRARAGGLASALGRFAPQLLVVDLFWAPLRHILPLADCEAWLLVRSVPRAWFGGPPDTRWEPRQFRRIVAIEPMSHPAVRDRIDPVVVCNLDETKPPGALRAHLGVAAGASLVVATHAGTAGEIDTLAGGGVDVVRCDLFQDAALFPLAEWLGDADRVIAGAGYNSFWEARWLGWAERTTFMPFARAIDDQRWRVATCRTYPMQANGADTIAGWVRTG